MEDADILWDDPQDPDGNVQHIRRHGISTDEVESVLRNPDNPTEESRTSGSPITFGWTHTNRHIAVVWEDYGDNPQIMYPVTAYEVPPPQE